MIDKPKSTSVWFSPSTQEKLSQMSRELGISRNATLELLVANAEIRDVVRREPIAALSVEKNNRQAAQTSTGTGSMAVSA